VAPRILPQQSRVAIYARVSTKDKGQEVENQLRQLREFSVLQGWTVVREYIDHESGSTNERAEFQAMFRDASQRKFDVLLFWALDRLSREGVLETLQHLSRLTAFGVCYRSFTEQYFDSCGIFKDAVIAIIATVAKQERVRISQRVRAGLDLARAKGRRIGRPPQTPLSPELRSAIANAYRCGGTSLRALAKQFGTSLATVQRCVARIKGLPTEECYLPDSSTPL
jgi:DNA invertase Pin-like site-specific DNA recombinase